MFVETYEIVRKANHIYKHCGSRDPYIIANELGIQIIECPFDFQRGAYKVIKRNRFIFVKEDLDPVMKNIVLLHEIGHDILHRNEATKAEWNTKQMSLLHKLPVLCTLISISLLSKAIH